ncbi:unnamed protein product [Rotaria socialis]
MYSGPNIAKPSGGAARTTLPVIGAIVCGGLLLLLLAATIILALIPIYLASKSVTLNTNSKSSLVTTYLNTDAGSGRRRRDTDDGKNIGSYAGGKFDTTSNTMVQEKFKNILLSNKKVSDILSFACLVVNINAKKRRYAFAKRATTTVIACSFYIQYISSCISTSCQTGAGTACTSLLQNGLTPSKFDFSNINILKSDGSLWITINRLRFTGFQFPPQILPGRGGGGNPTTRPTVPLVPTTTSPTPTSNTG